jgi:hypothetical protein
MLTPALDTVQFGTAFSTTIVVSTSDTTIDPDTGLPVTTDTPVTDLPTVTASFVDPGVVVSVGSGTVTLSGTYVSIIPITWHWLDLNNQPLSGTVPPAPETYSKIVQVDSPGFLSKDCNYTITTSGGSDVFAHTVKLSSWTIISDKLQTLLQGTL